MGSFTDTLPTGLAAGDAITDSALVGKIMALLTAITDPWTAYVPTWGATSAPSKGSGTIDGAGFSILSTLSTFSVAIFVTYSANAAAINSSCSFL